MDESRDRIDRGDIFGGDDPVRLAGAWLKEAEAAEPHDANAMALATVDAAGLPNVRIVLLKEIEENGFVFYTNYESAKGRELDAAGQAAFVMHWKSLRRQVRARGRIERVSAGQSDRYFQTRALDSRLGAWASRQSEPLESRHALETAVAGIRERFGDDPPRPEHWGGYRLIPLQMEFWRDGAHRIHDRFRWTRPSTSAEWTVSRLFP
jgi:pyridoxamine 5'-phosphate oxidase